MRTFEYALLTLALGTLVVLGALSLAATVKTSLEASAERIALVQR